MVVANHDETLVHDVYEHLCFVDVSFLVAKEDNEPVTQMDLQNYLQVGAAMKKHG